MPTAADGPDGIVEAPVAGPATLADLQTFVDVPAGYWASGAIDRLAAAGAVAALPDGTFRPDSPVIRAEFVKMLDLALGLPPDAAAGPAGFADVPVAAWFEPWVARAAAAGIVRGESPAALAPGAVLTREQMAVPLSLQLTPAAPPSFADAADLDAWAATGVGAAVAAGYLHGFPDGTLRPRAAATRAQAAQVLSLVLLRRAGASA